MTWYNPFTWFGKSVQDVQEEADRLLRCDNPQCQGVIETDEIAYDEEHKEIYHSYECFVFAKAHRVRKTGKSEVGNVDYISREKALRFLQSGKLKQSQGLEERVFN